MKLQQLRYLKAVAENRLNVTEAAEKLFTSQSGVSKQIRMLEDELGVQLFHRNGKQLTHITPVGRQILERVDDILRDVRNIKLLAEEFRDDEQGELRIATTHTQARYVLPPVIDAFRRQYPRVVLYLDQGTPDRIALMAASGEVDFALATEAIAQRNDLVMMPVYRWYPSVVVPRDHPLAKHPPRALKDVARFPIVTYVRGFTGRGQLEADFRRADLSARFLLSAADSDVIKTYVRLGLGIGIIAHMAYEPGVDSDLVYLDGSHLFTENVTKLGFRRGLYMRGFMYDLLQRFAPHLDMATVDRAAHTATQEEVVTLFEKVKLPML